MSHLLPSEKLEEQLPKLLPGVLALYRKHAETFHVSKVRACTPRPVQSSVHRPVPTWLRWEGVDTREGKRRERCWTQWWVGPRHVSPHCPALPSPGHLHLGLTPSPCRRSEPSPPVFVLDVEVGIPYLSPEVGSLWPGGGAGGS